MTSGSIVAAILEKDNAVADFRELVGATNPAEAKEGTIRAKYAKSIGENAVHGSDSDENAQIEGDFHLQEPSNSKLVFNSLSTEKMLLRSRIGAAFLGFIWWIVYLSFNDQPPTPYCYEPFIG